MRYIDATPTWAGLMPALLAIINDGTSEGADAAAEELMRLARALDQRIADERIAEAARPYARFRGVIWTRNAYGDPITVWLDEGEAQDVAAYAMAGHHPAETDGVRGGRKLTAAEARALGAGWPDHLAYRR